MWLEYNHEKGRGASKGNTLMTGSDLRTEKTRAIFPTARILLRMTSLRIAEDPPGTSPECKIKTQYTTLSIQYGCLHPLLLIFLALTYNEQFAV